MRRIARHAAGLVLALAAIAPLVPLAAARQEEDAAKPEATAPKKREAWDAVFLGGRKVGYIHTQVEPVTASDGRKLLRVQVDTVLALKRLNDKTEIKTRYGTIETYEGEVLRLDSRTLVGPQEIRISGDAHAGMMPLTLDAGGQTQRLSIPWGADVRGPYGPEMSLSRTPIQPGESREVKTFIPDLNQVGLTKMQAQQYGEIELGGGAVMNLLRVDSRVLGPDGRPLPGMDSTYYVDAAGQILKSETDVFGGLVTYRTTREAALKPATGGFPIVENLIVKVSRQITNPESTRSAVYAVNFDGEEPIADLFPPTTARRSSRADDGSTQLHVRTVGPDTNAVAGADPEYLAPNPMINQRRPEGRRPDPAGDRQRRRRCLEQGDGDHPVGRPERPREELRDDLRDRRGRGAEPLGRLLRARRPDGRHVPGRRHPLPGGRRPALRRQSPGLRLPHVERGRRRRPLGGDRLGARPDGGRRDPPEAQRVEPRGDLAVRQLPRRRPGRGQADPRALAGPVSRRHPPGIGNAPPSEAVGTGRPIRTGRPRVAAPARMSR